MYVRAVCCRYPSGSKRIIDRHACKLLVITQMVKRGGVRGSGISPRDLFCSSEAQCVTDRLPEAATKQEIVGNYTGEVK